MIVDDSMEQAEFRRVVALDVLYWLEAEIHRNGDRYNGSLIPNFTSVAIVLANATRAELEELAVMSQKARNEYGL